MNSNVVGILLIIGMIVIGIITGGDIFRGGGAKNATSTAAMRESTYYDEYDYSGSGDSDNESVDPNASVYVDKVFINGLSNAGTFNEYITLSTYLENENEKIGITGWRIKSTITGREIIIGGAANIPTEGVKDQSPILLSSDDRVIVSPGTSPVGTSFRANKCTGFFEEKHNFTPGLWTQCPAISDDIPASLSRTFNDDCLDYLDSLPGCEVPRERDIPDYLSIGNSCKNYLETKINYVSCVAKHVGDEDFYEPEWRIYSGQRGTVTEERHDNLVLLDNAGRVVDTYKY